MAAAGITNPTTFHSSYVPFSSGRVNVKGFIGDIDANSATSGGLGGLRNLNVLNYGADPTGLLDSTSAFIRWFAVLVGSKKPINGYIPGGAYTISSPLVWDFAQQNNTGVMIYGDGMNQSLLNFTMTSSPALLITSSNGAAFFLTFKDFGISSNTCNGTLLQFGQTNFSDALNSCIIGPMVLQNGSNSASTVVVQFNYVLNCDIYVVANGGSSLLGDAIQMRQMQFSTIKGAAGHANNGINMLTGYNYGNVIQTTDIETVNTCVACSSASSTHNTVLGGAFVWNTNAFNVSAGNLRVIAPLLSQGDFAASVFATGTSGNVIIETQNVNAPVPNVPSSGSPVINTTGSAINVFVYGGSVTVATVIYNGTTTTISPFTGGSIPLSPGSSITLTYGSAPSWQWFTIPA